MKIVVADPLGIPTEELYSKIEKAAPGCEIVCCETRTEDVDTLIERCHDAEIVVISNIKFKEDVLSKCPSLKYVCVAFTGYDHLDVEYCKANGITVSNCAGYSTSAVADLVFGMVISLYRDIIGNNEAAKNGGTKTMIGPELEGKTFGIVGLGAIGTRVARIAQAFGCKVIATSRTPKSVEGIEFTDLDTVMRDSDIVSVHVPCNASTMKLISEDKIALMNENTIFINCARGPIVDNEALAKALNDGKLGYACVDVFDMEPPIPADYPLLQAKNTLLTPHQAFISEESMVRRAKIVFDNVTAYLDGKPVNVCKL